VFDATINRQTGSPTIVIRQRYVGHSLVLATANWLFWTHDVRLVSLDAEDRRGMMIETIND
jgi:hypothetical protein